MFFVILGHLLLLESHKNLKNQNFEKMKEKSMKKTTFVAQMVLYDVCFLRYGVRQFLSF